MQDQVLNIARRYSLPPQLASLLHELIVEDVLTETKASAKGLPTPLRFLVHRLKKTMPTALVQNRSRVGYWLPDALRIGMATEIGIVLPMATLARMTRERHIAEGVIEFLEKPREEHLHCGTDVECPEVQLSGV